MESLEAGARDDSTVVEWQAKMKEQDMQRKMEEIEMRRLDGKLSQEEAIMARQRAVQEKRDTVAEMKVQVLIFNNQK